MTIFRKETYEESYKWLRMHYKLDTQLAKVLANWYADGFATWDYRGAPGEDGKWGGSFHSMTIHEYDVSGYKLSCTIGMDFGSADHKEAVKDLDTRLVALGLEVKDRGEYSIDIGNIGQKEVE